MSYFRMELENRKQEDGEERARHKRLLPDPESNRMIEGQFDEPTYASRAAPLILHFLLAMPEPHLMRTLQEECTQCRAGKPRRDKRRREYKFPQFIFNPVHKRFPGFPLEP